MIFMQRAFTRASSRSLNQPSPSIKHVFKRYSSSSSSSSSSPDLNSPQAQDTKEIEKESEETIKASTSSVEDSLKSPISTQTHTSSIQNSTTPTLQQKSTSFITQSAKHSASTSHKSARSFKSKPVSYNVPYVPSTQHLNVERIFEDTFFQGFRPLLSPIRDMKKYMSLTLPTPPPKNNRAYWNTSVCQVEEFAKLDCVPKFIGDGMKAFKVPKPPGNEVRIFPRDNEETTGVLSRRMKKYVQKELEKEKKAFESRKITAYRYHD